MTSGRSRAEQKEHTRSVLLEGALELSAERGFTALSLREVARAAGVVPTAFYRHFETLDDLGLALVSDGMRALRTMLREARTGRSIMSTRASLDVLAKHIEANPGLLRFVYRERFGGAPRIRNEVATELNWIIRDLTVDLARMPGMTDWPGEDLDMAANLLVAAMWQAMGDLLDAYAQEVASGPRAADIISRSEKQMRLIVLGMAAWRP